MFIFLSDLSFLILWPLQRLFKKPTAFQLLWLPQSNKKQVFYFIFNEVIGNNFVFVQKYALNDDPKKLLFSQLAHPQVEIRAAVLLCENVDQLEFLPPSIILKTTILTSLNLCCPLKKCWILFVIFLFMRWDREKQKFVWNF